MPIENIPEIYLSKQQQMPELFLYDFKMTKDSIKTKVNLNMHMFSFLQTGKKHVHFANTSILVDSTQSLLLKKGNCLWSELLDTEKTYFCKLLFFSDEQLQTFIQKHVSFSKIPSQAVTSFTFKNDAYLQSYIQSITSLSNINYTKQQHLLSLKFEELMLYLLQTYKIEFQNFLLSLIQPEDTSFKRVIEQSIYSNLTIEEMAFLCNMSLSTFKRYFSKQFHESPGHWFRNKRLLKAKEKLEQEKLKPSDIYLDLGYNNLSNFSIAFKNKFGVNPSEV